MLLRLWKDRPLRPKACFEWSGETDQIIGILKSCRPFLSDAEDEKATQLIAEGEDYREFWQAFAHGADLASPVHPALRYRERFFQWKEEGAEISRRVSAAQPR